MDAALLIPTVMTVLTPFLTKAGEKVAETVGEKLTNKVLERNLWSRAKELFIEDNDEKTIQGIEKKDNLTKDDLQIIETKLVEAVNSDPAFADKLQADLKLSYTNSLIVDNLMRSIQNDRLKIEEYYNDRSNASIETEGSYDIMINRTLRRLKKDENKLIETLRNSQR